MRGRITFNPPLNPDQLGPNSYDVRLGSWYYRQRQMPKDGLIYPDTRDLWEDEPCQLIGDDAILWLRPGETVLAHTEETIGTYHNVVAVMAAKSTAGRSCIEVCKCAGFGDIGFHSKWTMEITNNSTTQKVGIRYREPIAQMIFHKVETLPDRTYEQTGRYVSISWTPYNMLPKGKRD